MRGSSCRRAVLLVALLAVGSGAVSSAAAASPAAKCRVVHHKKVCAKPKPKPKPKPAPAPTLAAKIPLGGQIFDIADGFGSIWARVGTDTNGGDTLLRIDPATNAVVARIPVPKGFGIAVGETAVWTTNFTANTVSRIDPVTNTIVATVALSDVRPAAITTTPGSVWVGTEGADNASGWVFHISSTTNAIIEGSSLPGADGASDIAWSGGALWISGGQELLRASDTDLNTTVVREIANQNACGGMTSDATTVWIAGGNCGFPKFPLAVVTAADGKTVATPSVPTLSDVALGLGAAWAIATNGTLIRLDTATHTEVSSTATDVSGSTAAIDVALGGVWVGGADGTLERFAP